MLKILDPLLGPELLLHLCAMGHGDELVIVDANFPATSLARRLVRLDGVDSTRALQAVLQVLPLDSYVPHAVQVMHVVGGTQMAPVTEDFRAVVQAQAGAAFTAIGGLERQAFYERARSAYLIIATGERRLYGNLILSKGVIENAG